MKFHALPLAGAYLIYLEPKFDNRGMFARSYCQEEFKTLNLPTNWLQDGISYNKEVGVLRGLHYQKSPYDENKLIRCVRGKIFDVIVDVRQDSPTYGKWQVVLLQENDWRYLYVPAGFAHGFQTLLPNTEILYRMDKVYNMAAAFGINHNCPTLNIPWPYKPIISNQDELWPNLTALKENV